MLGTAMNYSERTIITAAPWSCSLGQAGAGFVPQGGQGAGDSTRGPRPSLPLTSPWQQQQHPVLPSPAPHVAWCRTPNLPVPHPRLPTVRPTPAGAGPTSPQTPKPRAASPCPAPCTGGAQIQSPLPLRSHKQKWDQGQATCWDTARTALRTPGTPTCLCPQPPTTAIPPMAPQPAQGPGQQLPHAATARWRAPTPSQSENKSGAAMK